MNNYEMQKFCETGGPAQKKCTSATSAKLTTVRLPKTSIYVFHCGLRQLENQIGFSSKTE